MPRVRKLTPNLIVANVERSIAFYRDVLGFTVQTTVPETAPFVFGIVESGAVEIFFNAAEAAYAEYPSLMTSRKLCPLLGNAIDGWEAKRRFVQFGLKLSGKGKPDADNGVVVAEYRRRFGSDLIEDFHDTLTTLTDIGLLEPDWRETVRLTPAGLLLSYHVVKQF